MAYQRMTQEYQKSAVNGASPLQLIIMLYDGALKFMQSGKAAMAEGNRDAQNASLQKAQKVLMELMSCLDMKQGGEIAKNLLSLYSYVLNELVMANMADDPDGVDRGIKVLTDLRESWREIQTALRPAQEPRLAA